jgi:putative SOS response-associated peptidase YedK
MCGRYTLTTEENRLERRHGVIVRFDGNRFLPRYNIAPTQLAPVALVSEEGLEVANLRWGLIPFWAKDAKIGNSLINARSETVAEKPAFRAAFKKRRCLVFTDGFYEWRKMPTGKIPVWITRKDKMHFYFAGLWEHWKNPEGEEVRTFTILTTTPNELLASVHDRMPVILDEKDHELWLDPKVNGKEALTPLLRPYPSDEMEFFSVSTLVNSPRNNDPKCIERVEGS